ncbi:MAG: hypothetical protein J6Q94_03760 [Clostridia bacterium]|nr:hypothetical protein [Clostridia bacterium]
MKTKILSLIAIISMFCIIFCGCSDNTKTPDEVTSTVTETQENETDFSEKQTQIKESSVSAVFTADAETFDEYETFVIDETEYSTKILFIAEGVITDFSFDSLLVTDVDDNGNMTFNSQSLYTLDELKESKPLEVTLTFYGDTPAYGISYNDAAGETKNFTVTLSGEDGSVILTEI